MMTRLGSVTVKTLDLQSRGPVGSLSSGYCLDGWMTACRQVNHTGI